MADPFIKNVCAVAVGNILEWYDFAIFGALADILGYRFFPKHFSSTALVASLSLFGSAFFMRPIGGLLMGYVGDNYGRKRALEFSVAMMVVPSFFMGCLPTFQQCGYFATVVLILLRLMQGLAVGGEMVGAFVFTIEATKGRNRGVWGAVVKATGLLGTAIGMGYVAFLRYILTERELLSWGWRIPFLSSLLMGIVASFLRSSIQETDEYTADNAAMSKQELKDRSNTMVNVFRVHWVEIILVAAVVAYWCVGYYTCFIWMGYYMSSLMGDISIKYAWELNIIMTLVLIGLMPLGGLLGDFACDVFREKDNGHRRVMLLGVGISAVFGAPAFALINYNKLWTACLGQAIFAISLAMYGSNLPAFVVQQFSVRYRYSGVGVAYNLSNAIFAGTAPLVQTALVMYAANSKSSLMVSSVGSMLPATYLCTIALVSTGVLFWAPPIINQRRIELEKTIYHNRDSSFSHRSSGGSTRGASLTRSSLSMDSSSSSVVSRDSLDTSSSPMLRTTRDGVEMRPTVDGGVNIRINVHVRSDKEGPAVTKRSKSIWDFLFRPQSTTSTSSDSSAEGLGKGGGISTSSVGGNSSSDKLKLHLLNSRLHANMDVVYG
eukprot:CAMPEP_0185041506 /NCGR_PEP_ID=MMETSP1103-20130426/40895_1 /TAXON_ID=36769 /ORGANISM="Paraphysomonas bandaiensis, Strain Caron Lab Isolate" /LENGTH=604 /DNA_ID=CAMNT_0027581265 /DNA_START=182 /DNA_END=1993 /DNA_ORIENTATION=+